MFGKILIANRGEIACRVIRTARRMGISTVAVHSVADARALHVRMADEAVEIGPPPSAQSYLDSGAVIAAARRTGAEAIHPGYGFLAENAGFVEAVGAAGIAFIGPPASAIAAMGDKIESKRLAARAGVSTVPGHDGEVPDAGQAAEIAAGIGYPVMLKATAGGGGKGMRIAHSQADIAEAFRATSSEARSSFGDDRILIEKYIEEPRHIEIQVLADAHTNVIHLGERECSIQRRHQKVIEEAPSPALDAATRAAMGEQAVALARAVGYVSAGTVEFIMDRERHFYFLEMNTRLQVEHPVTEMVTGLDLVEAMIRIAAGEPLALGQEAVKLFGWAMEARVYAEDPQRGFMPSIGRLTRYREPPPAANVRVDSGVHEGGEISIHYDPMIAKAVTWGEDRAAAAAAMRAALDGFQIRGVNHNISFLNAVMAHPRFLEGRLSTDFIAEEFPDGFMAAAPGRAEVVRLAAVAAVIHRRVVGREAAISGQLAGHEAVPGTIWVVRAGTDDYPVVLRDSGGGYEATVEGGTHRIVSDWHPGAALFEGTLDGAPVRVQVDRIGPGYTLFHGGVELRVLVLTPRAAALAALMPVKAPPDTSKFLLSPMPGLLLSLAVREGQEIKMGEVLAVVEAMKMENVLRAARDGTVLALHAGPGDSLAADQAILEFG